MRRLRLISMCLSGCALAATPASGADQYRLRQVEVIDQNGFGQPVVASRLLIPHDWQASGGVMWNPQATCHGDVVRVQWQASDATGHNGVEVLPALQWEANSLQYPGACPAFTFQSAQEYLQAVVGYYRQGAQIVDYRLRTDLMQELPAIPDAGHGPRTNREIGEILIAYDMGGQDEREIIRAQVTVTVNTLSDGLTTMSFLNGYAEPAFAMRAPNGALDFGLFDFVTRSVRLDPQWDAQLAQVFGNIGRVASEEGRKRARIIGETNAAISDIITQGYESAQAASDRNSEAWSEAMRGVETYNDPRSGEQIELPSTYANAWRMIDGTYVVTADSNFDPNVAFGIESYRLEVAP